jgi:hypothetical protein
MSRNPPYRDFGLRSTVSAGAWGNSQNLGAANRPMSGAKLAVMGIRAERPERREGRDA